MADAVADGVVNPNIVETQRPANTAQIPNPLDNPRRLPIPTKDLISRANDDLRLLNLIDGTPSISLRENGFIQTRGDMPGEKASFIAALKKVDSPYTDDGGEYF